MKITLIKQIGEEQLASLCELLIDSVQGGASIGFHSPLSMKKAREYWNEVDSSLPSGRILLIAEEDSGIAGSVQLAPCLRENGKHRGEIQKLFVLQSHRGQGIAKKLMQSAERHAAEIGLSLLVLDTQEGSPAQYIYQHLGWAAAGIIPGYASSPEGTLHGTVILYNEISPVSADRKDIP
ncbi:GNAT family N-acetyltransferase [Maridesulfovibrio sp. FT414]|uniref:GNAT family N-acetyltransferase n=1 Tax=Maridesulfovibrio sp. FT414 TaxID=2979469 RepID=UPI003D8019A3